VLIHDVTNCGHGHCLKDAKLVMVFHDFRNLQPRWVRTNIFKGCRCKIVMTTSDLNFANQWLIIGMRFWRTHKKCLISLIRPRIRPKISKRAYGKLFPFPNYKIRSSI